MLIGPEQKLELAFKNHQRLKIRDFNLGDNLRYFLATLLEMAGKPILASYIDPQESAILKAQRLLAYRIPGNYVPSLVYTTKGLLKRNLFCIEANTNIGGFGEFRFPIVSGTIAITRPVTDQPAVQVRPGQVPLLFVNPPYSVEELDVSTRTLNPLGRRYIISTSSVPSEITVADLSDIPEPYHTPSSRGTLRLLTQN